MPTGSATDDILPSLPLDQIAAELGTDPAQVSQAAQAVIPALLGGMQANTEQPGGTDSLLDALTQHSSTLADSPDLGAIDTADGQKIAQHVFGGHEEQVVTQLGGLAPAGGSGNQLGSALVKKLIPILAPIVLSYLAKQLGARPGAGSGPGQVTGAGAGSAASSILEEILKGAISGAGGKSAGSGGMGDILGDVLGGLLGGGSRK